MPVPERLRPRRAHWPYRSRHKYRARIGGARRAPYLDLRGGASAAGAEEAIGRGGGGLGGGGADGVGAAVAHLVGAAVTHRRRASPPSVSRSPAGRGEISDTGGEGARGDGGVAASSQRASGVVETTRRLGPSLTRRRCTVRGRAGWGRARVTGRNLRLCPWTAERGLTLAPYRCLLFDCCVGHSGGVWRGGFVRREHEKVCFEVKRCHTKLF